MAILLTGCSGGPGGKAEMPEQDEAKAGQVRQLLSSYYDAMSRRDWKKHRMLFRDSATITTAWQKPGDPAAAVHLQTIDEFIRQTPQGPDSKPIFEERMTGSWIRATGNLAEAWAYYEASFGSTDSLLRWKGRDLFTFMYHRGNGRLCLFALRGNSAPDEHRHIS